MIIFRMDIQVFVQIAQLRRQADPAPRLCLLNRWIDRGNLFQTNPGPCSLTCHGFNTLPRSWENPSIEYCVGESSCLDRYLMAGFSTFLLPVTQLHRSPKESVFFNHSRFSSPYYISHSAIEQPMSEREICFSCCRIRHPPPNTAPAAETDPKFPSLFTRYCLLSIMIESSSNVLP